MENNQELQLTEEEIQAMIENGEVVLQGENNVQEEIIPFDYELIPIVNGVTKEYKLDEVAFEEGVKEASKYLGQFSALIGNGLSSEFATIVMNWIHDDKITKDSIEMQIELAKQESIKIKRESL